MYVHLTYYLYSYTGSRLQRVWIIRTPDYNEQIFFSYWHQCLNTACNEDIFMWIKLIDVSCTQYITIYTVTIETVTSLGNLQRGFNTVCIRLFSVVVVVVLFVFVRRALRLRTLVATENQNQNSVRIKIQWNPFTKGPSTLNREAMSITRAGFPLFYPIKFPDFSLTFPWFFLSFHQDISVKKKTFIFFKCGLSDISVCKYCLIKCNFLTVPENKFLQSLKKHFSLDQKAWK